MNKLPDGLVERSVWDLDEECTGCIANDDRELCLSLPYCTPTFRKDSRNVIFVKDENHV